MSVTLKDIAEASEVSISTASRALSGHPGIKAGTVAKVKEIAERLNYKIRQSSSEISSLMGAEVGILCLGMGRSLTSLPTVSAAIEGAENALTIEGARTVFISIPDLKSPPESLLTKLPDALILVGALQGDVLSSAQPNFLRKLKSLPTVWLIGRPKAGWGDRVGCDEFEVGAIAARTLLRAGHRRLAFINPKPDHLVFQRREDGFIATARREGVDSVISLSESPQDGWQLPLQVPKNVEAVQALVDQAIAANPRPTGVFAAADSVAVLIYRALATRGLSVGSDFSLVSGNHDASLIAGLHPTLTTCDVDAFAIGQTAVRQLGLRLRRGDGLPENQTLLTPRLVEGESVYAV